MLANAIPRRAQVSLASMELLASKLAPVLPVGAHLGTKEHCVVHQRSLVPPILAIMMGPVLKD